MNSVRAIIANCGRQYNSSAGDIKRFHNAGCNIIYSTDHSLELHMMLRALYKILLLKFMCSTSVIFLQYAKYFHSLFFCTIFSNIQL